MHRPAEGTQSDILRHCPQNPQASLLKSLNDTVPVLTLFVHRAMLESWGHQIAGSQCRNPLSCCSRVDTPCPSFPDSCWHIWVPELVSQFSSQMSPSTDLGSRSRFFFDEASACPLPQVTPHRLGDCALPRPAPQRGTALYLPSPGC